MSDAKSPEHNYWSAEEVAIPSGLSSRILASIAHRLHVGQLSLVLPKAGNQVVTGAEHPELRAVIDVKHPAALVRKLVFNGSTGIAEAYVDGDWDTPDLVAFLQLALVNEEALGRFVQGTGLALLARRLRHLARANTRRGSRRNIAFHYDLGNTFYARWLDPGMTYSSALFDAAELSLEDAQDKKYRNLAESLGLRAGLHLLEIGCGWGGFALMAARDYGCRVTAITLSKEQLRYANERVRAAGLSDRVEVRLQDYRDVAGQFDRIASIEMFEAVGEEHWPLFFDTVRERLKPGGVAGLQIITIEDDRFEQYRQGADFIQRYIFPGGMLPSPSALTREVDRAGLTLCDVFAFGSSYAETLAEWQLRFQRAWPQIRRLGFDGRFKRLWEFYLAYCEAGFRAGAVDVAHYRIERA